MEQRSKPIHASMHGYLREYIQPALDELPDDPRTEYDLILCLQLRPPAAAAAAAKQLYKKTIVPLAYFALRFTSDPSEALALIQETYETVLRKAKKKTLPSEPFPVLAYMKQICFHLYQRQLEARHQARRRKGDSSKGERDGFTLISLENHTAALSGKAGDADETERVVFQQIVESELIADLGDEDLIIVMMIRDGHPWSEIGEALRERGVPKYVASKSPKELARKRWERVLQPMLEERADKWQ